MTSLEQLSRKYWSSHRKNTNKSASPRSQGHVVLILRVNGVELRRLPQPGLSQLLIALLCVPCRQERVQHQWKVGMRAQQPWQPGFIQQHMHQSPINTTFADAWMDVLNTDINTCLLNNIQQPANTRSIADTTLGKQEVMRGCSVTAPPPSPEHGPGVGEAAR